jgi:hypothetical protein
MGQHSSLGWEIGANYTLGVKLLAIETRTSNPDLKDPDAHVTEDEAQTRFVLGIQLWGLLLLTLHLAAFKLPEEAAWSLWPYTFLPAGLGWILALLAAALIIPPVNQVVCRWTCRLWLAWPAKYAYKGWFALAAGLAGVIFWLARLRHLRWGDSYLLSVALSYPDLDLRVIYNWQAPLTVFIHQRLWQFVADPWLGWPVANVYSTLSILAGMIFVYVLLLFTVDLGRDPLEAAILAGMLLTTGSMQLFFGYVENYTIVSLALMVTLFLAWRALRAEIQPLWPILSLSLANALHPSTVFLWPGLWLLSWQCWRRGYVSPAGALLQTVLPPLLVAGGVLVLMESGGHGVSALLGVDRPGGGDGIWFVPLFATTTAWQRYTLFSVDHILDWANVHLLISPFGLPILILAVSLLGRYRLAIFKTPTEKDFAYFLGVTSAMYLLLTWFWNPDYGGRKDWDLFAPSAFVYTLLAGYLVVHILRDRQKLAEVGLFIIVISLLHTGAWIFTNSQELPEIEES